MHKTFIDIPLKTRQEVIKIMSARLNDAVDLGIQAKLAHWNIRGATFIAVHELFDKIVDMAQDSADLIAERIGQLGGSTKGTAAVIAKESTLPKFDTSKSAAKDVITILAKAIAQFTKGSRAAIDQTDDLDDKVTADMFTNISKEADKLLWFVEAHLQ